MKKSIFLFFAAILCAMTANAQWALMGTLTDWSSGKAMSVSGTNATCTVDLPGKTTYTLKVKNGSTWYGRNSTTISATTTTSAFSTSGGDVTLNTDIPGTYTFSFNTSTKKLTVTYPTAPAPHDITVRAQVPASWTNTITAWVWTSENGAGEEVTPTKDGDYYVVTKNAGALYVIFKNGAGWNGDKNQTIDLCYTEDVCLQLNQSGSAKATATVIECGAVSKDITVKAVVPGAWENTITAWVWPTGGEGKEVTPTKDGNWYVVTENCIELNVIFKNGTGWNGNENQTANITGVSENTCYQISAINKDGEGKCTYTVVDCEEAIEPEAKPVDVYTIVGAETLVGAEWDVNNTANDMTKQGDGSYVLVKENVELATTGTYEYKVVKNRSWDWKAINEGNNLTLTGVDVDGTYNVTFTLNKELNALTTSLELVEAKKVIPECYVAGDESLTGQDWNAKSVSMTYDEATEVYTATLTAVPAGTHNMKVVYGGEWLGFDHLATPAPANVKEGEDKKIQFTLAEAGDVTVTYHATNGIGLTGNFAVPAPKYYIAGSENLTGFDWKENGLQLTKDGDLYKHTFSALAAGTFEFKVTNGTWTDPWGYSNLGAAYEEVSQGTDGEGNPNGNIKFVTEEAKNITVIFDPAAGKITFEGLTEKAPAVITYQLKGVGGWSEAGIEMTENPDKAGEYMLTCQAISATDAVKVVKLADGVITDYYGNGTVKDGVEVTVNYDSDGNITLPEGKYNFYFDTNESEKKLWIAAATDCVTEPEYNVVEDEITNFVFDTEAWPMVCMGGPSTNYQIEVFLTLTEDADGTLAYEDCSVSIMGTDATFIDGTLSNIDVYAPYADAVLHVQWDGDYYELQLAMSSTPAAAITIEAEDATVTLTEYPTNFEETEFAYELAMVANWVNEAESLPYRVEFIIPTFDPTAASGEYIANFYVTGEGDAAGMNENISVTVTKDGNNVTLTGNVSALNGNAYDVTISGTLPAAEPEYNVVEDEITNFVFDTEAWPMVCMGGPSTTYQIEVFLTLTEDADGTLAYEDCSVSIMGTDATFIDGTLSNIDPFAPYADAVLHVQWDGDYFELQLAMSSTPAEAVTIEAEDATVTLTEYPTNFEETEFAYELAMVANWVNEAELLPYRVEFVIPTFDPTAASGEYIANFYVTGEGDAAGMNENISVTVTKDGNNVTLTGNVSALNGNAYNVTISGALPTETPEVYTRTVTTGNYGTICLPYASSSYSGAEFYEVSWLSEGAGLYLDQLAAGDQLEAGKPYIFKATDSEITVTYTGEAEAAPVAGANGLTGTFTDIAANGILVDNYIIAQNLIWVAGASTTLPANRAYINKADVPTTEQAKLPGRRRVCMGENAETGVDNIITTDAPVKVIENGQLIIIRNGEKFNVQGQKL